MSMEKTSASYITWFNGVRAYIQQDYVSLFRKVSLEQMSSRLNVVAPSQTDQETDPVQGHLADCAENERQSPNFKLLRLK